ncbi:MAG: DUF6515 family protein [Gammaproteobacteria bacterium]
MKRIKSKPSVALSFMSALLPGLLIGLVGLTGNDVLVKDAQAVVGRPASPGSVAGIHRRETRRTVRATSYYGGGAVTTGSSVYTLPPGCVAVIHNAATYYYCDGIYYQPYYQGNQLVYVPVEAP